MGWEKIGALAHKNGNISETGKDRENLLYGMPIGSRQLSFERYHPRPLRPLLPQDWGSPPPQTSIAIIS